MKAGSEANNDSMWIDLSDGRTIGVALVWFPRLMKATNAERGDYSISQSGLHWEAIDEDISIEGLLAGKGDQTKNSSEAAQPPSARVEVGCAIARVPWEFRI